VKTVYKTLVVFLNVIFLHTISASFSAFASDLWPRSRPFWSQPQPHTSGLKKSGLANIPE